jgi:hypothetical protein
MTLARALTMTCAGFGALRDGAELVEACAFCQYDVQYVKPGQDGGKPFGMSFDFTVVNSTYRSTSLAVRSMEPIRLRCRQAATPDFRGRRSRMPVARQIPGPLDIGGPLLAWPSSRSRRRCPRRYRVEKSRALPTNRAAVKRHMGCPVRR